MLLLAVAQTSQALEVENIGIGMGPTFGGLGVSADFPVSERMVFSLGIGKWEEVYPSFGFKAQTSKHTRLSLFYSINNVVGIDSIPGNRMMERPKYKNKYAFKGVSAGLIWNYGNFDFGLHYHITSNRDGENPIEFTDRMSEAGLNNSLARDFSSWRIGYSLGYNISLK